MFKQFDGLRRLRMECDESDSDIVKVLQSDSSTELPEVSSSISHGSDHNIRVTRTVPNARASANMIRRYHWVFVITGME